MGIKRKSIIMAAIVALSCICACAGETPESVSTPTSEPETEVSVSVSKEQEPIVSESVVSEPEEAKEEPTPEPEPEKEVVYETLTDEEAAPYLEHLSISDNDTSLGNMVLSEDGLFLFYYDCGEDFKAEDSTLRFKYDKDNPGYIRVELVYGDKEMALGTYDEVSELGIEPCPRFFDDKTINLGNIPDYIINNEYECAIVKGCPDDDNCLLIDFGTEIGTVETGNIRLDGGDGEYVHVQIADKPMFAVLVDPGQSRCVFATTEYFKETERGILCYVGMKDGKVRWIYQLFVS